MACGADVLASLLLLSAAPGIEARYAAAIGSAICGPEVIPLAYVVSTITGILVYLLLEKVERLIAMIPILLKIYEGVKRRVSKKLKGARGAFALTLFIAAPLPGSGVWTGALAARLMDLSVKEAVAAICIGNLVAVLIVAGGVTGLLALLG
ncbi:small multi-drug export protein [Pyrolobus fumarii 1A]|uniref:Small multi-drug export protein n=1 Tax=Pyrolobus fumarii (strain DSM 11204 / 1A) TaxID=694429 RepID=G0EFC3_PYRF1|nr:small multi-drug export protein [Pyrolobus fumarii]AEM38166.1 small multi-drug export protein [Pyrolobus fumarii 1A]